MSQVKRKPSLSVEQSLATSDGQRAHRELLRIGKARARLDWEEGRWLLMAHRAGVHHAFGFANFAQYAERLLGYRPRWTEEKLRVARALEELPQVSEALQSGSWCWSVIRELTRVATADTEEEWLLAARGRTTRDVESLVSGHQSGDRPGSRKDPLAQRHALRFEVAAETLALFREAAAKLRCDAGGVLDDDALLLGMARQILGGPKDDGRANYQIAVSVCSACRQGSVRASGEHILVTPELVAMAECDAQQVQVAATDNYADAHQGSPHVGGAVPASNAPRASQNIPPATRRLVRLRGGHCVVPGCRNSLCDIHHLNPRAEGIDHDPQNLALICTAHHRAVHRGQLLVDGNHATGFRFRHTDGSVYGEPSCPQTALDRGRAFQALCRLGFRPSAARRALEQVGAMGGADASLEHCVRQALRLLTESRAARADSEGARRGAPVGQGRYRKP